ncbi:von Willebrand factor D and EGF domain-containing protein-like [Ostrea edulis]|uniref:von Willebrand factor D and EGF domain-containing protein-like n=1 Tax=Ostrea edulis TaxID=37623 RepID=UPI0024AFE928|nr:von Willebrand factor D and EGF domain-containing protein-like [Ostrea edulis]
MWNSVIYFTFISTVSLVVPASGQCNNYILQSNQYKRSAGYQLTSSDTAISDNFLTEGWYRFQSGAGNDMVRSPPALSKCGTIFPVWLNGNLPSQADGVVSRNACVVGVGSTCESNIPIQIANCGTFNVYYLRKTSATATGYCFGEEVKCPDGQGSENGFTPGCQTLPSIPVSPTVIADLATGPAILPDPFGPSVLSFFECYFDSPSISPCYFDIAWYINGDTVRGLKNVEYGNLSTTRLLPEHWNDQYHLNMVVKCSVRGRATSWGTPTNKVFSADYQAGLFPESYVYHINEGQTISIPFRVTYPVGCISTTHENKSCITIVYLVTPKYQPTPETCENVQTTDPILFDQNRCGIAIASATWNESKSLTVSGNVDNLINAADRDIFIRLGILGESGDFSKAWHNTTVPDIKIYIADVDGTISNRVCKLQTDPRLWTFDNYKHDINMAGEYVLYLNKKRDISIHALFTSCSAGGAACSCGIAVRVEDSLYVYRTCDVVSYQYVSHLAHHSTIYEVCDDKHMVITEESDYTHIALPTGTKVKFKVHSNWIQHLHIIPSVFDIGNMEGICGNANGNPSDDFVSPDGSTPTQLESDEIDQIISTWRIVQTSSNSLFSANPALVNNELNLQKYCSCASEAEGPNYLKNISYHNTANCNITTTVVDCSQQQTTSSYLTTCNRIDNSGRKRRDLSEEGYGERTKRVRRSTTDSDDVIDFEPLTYDSSFDPTYIPPVPTWRNGWTESTARAECETSINNDPVKLECEKYIQIEELVNNSISACILDIRDSATTEWIAGTVDALKSYCLTMIAKYEKFHITNNTNEMSVLQIFNSVTCVNNCSNHGSCTDKGKCACDTGFIGIDCSRPKSSPPENAFLPEEGLCQKSKRQCAKTNIIGDFLSDATVYVQIKEYVISNSKGQVRKTLNTTAQFRAPNLITVVIPSSTRKKRSTTEQYGTGYDISLSYDGSNFGDQLSLIVYDDACYNCNATTIGCTILDSCINNTTKTTDSDATTTTAGTTTTATTSAATSTTAATSTSTTSAATSTTLLSSTQSSTRKADLLPVSSTSTPSSTSSLLLSSSSSVPRHHEEETNEDKSIIITASVCSVVVILILGIGLFLKFKNKNSKRSAPMLYSGESLINGQPPLQTCGTFYDKPFSPPPPYQEPFKTNRPHSSSSIRATFDDYNSKPNFDFNVFSVEAQKPGFKTILE